MSAAAPPPSPPQPAAPSSSLLCRNPGPRWSSSKVISRQLKLAGATAAGAQVSPTPLRRRPQQQVASAAEPSAGAKKIIIPPSPASGRIQSRRSSNSPVPERRRRRRRRNAPYFNCGARRARSSAPGGGGGCNPAIIQAPGEKRKYSCASACYCPAWGAKRARSPICGVKPPVLHPQVDWANLGDGPAGLIAEFALANDVADYVRFRAVCRPWRRCSPDPRAGGLDGRFLPRRWIMLDTATPRRRRRFLNIATGECIQMDLPELAEHRFVALTPEGLLLLLHEPTLVVRLLNPLTRQLIDLPPVTTLLPEDQRAKPRPNIIGDEVYGAGLAGGASTVVVSFYDPKVLAFANPGDDCWTVVYNGNLHSTLPFAGRFYCCVGKRVMVLDMDQQPPLLREAVERTNLFYFSQMAHSLHLVDNAGELMLVHRSLHQDDPEHNRKMKYDVYRVDLDLRTLVPVKGFNGRAVFLGWDRTVSVAAEAFPSITADTLYPGSDIDESKTIGRCSNLADGSNLCEPYTVIDCLSYCIQGTGKELV